MPEQKFSAEMGKKKLPGTINDDRPLPHDQEAEAAVLGAAILEPKPLMEYATEIMGSAAYFFDSEKKRNKKQPVATFYNPRHQRIYSTLCQLHDEQVDIDLITLCNALSKKQVLEFVGGEAYLAELMNGVATTANFETWCRMVRDFAILRTLIGTCENIKDKCFDGEYAVTELLDQVEKEVLEAGQMEQRTDTLHIKDIITAKEDGAFNYLVNMMNKTDDIAGLSTGLPGLDKLITGLKPGEMFVLAARPSIGKTSLALNMMSNIALNQTRTTPVGFFSLEMTARQLAVRLLCTESGFSEKDFYDGNVTNMTKITSAASLLGNSQIFIDPTPALRIRELRSKARRMQSMNDIKVIFIDYLQLMKAEIRSDNRQEEVSTISSGIKALAKELNIPIVVLAQLNREVEKSATGTPKLSHLRESGAIEQDADIVAFLHRERDAQKESSPEFLAKGLEAKLIVEKNRNGQTGEVPLLFFPKLMLFKCSTRMSDEDIPR
jgi:replicative DNA helicase